MSVDSMEQEREYIRGMATRPEPIVPEVFLARITGARLANGNDGTVFSGSPAAIDTSRKRWIYSWEVYTNTDKDSNGYEFFAINGAENDNTQTDGVQSYGVSTSASSPTVSLLPIGNNDTQPIVLMMRTHAPQPITFNLYNSSDAATGVISWETQYFFSAGNDVEVSC